MNNPFNLTFGLPPAQFINRPQEESKILSTFCSDTPSNHMYLITGVRGSGKTVMLTNLSRQFSQKENWIVLEISPEDDLLTSIVSKLYNLEKIKPFFSKLHLGLSISGGSISIDNTAPAMTDEVVLEKMLTILKKKGKRLLICVDEASNNVYVKRFAHIFQIMIRAEYDLYTIMTGLYENIYSLQNEKSLTFLYRAPKIMLEPLNIVSIARIYEKTFHLDMAESMKMAKMTLGYPFAFQVLGYIRYEQNTDNLENLLTQYDQYLAEYVYDKIWSEFTENDKKIVTAIASTDDYCKIQTIRESLQMSSSLFSSYREKLIRKGIVDTSRYGYVKLVLPRLREYILLQNEYENM